MKPENWMKWDIGSDEDKATRWYLSRFDDELSGYGFFVKIVELLYQENDHWLMLDEVFVDGFASRYGWQPESVRQAIAYLIQARLFVAEQTSDGLRFASRKVLREVEHRTKKSRVNAENGRKGGLKSRGSKRPLGDGLPNRERPVSGAQAEERRGEESRSDPPSSVINVTPVIRESVLGAPPTPPPAVHHNGNGHPADPMLAEALALLRSPEDEPDADWTRSPAYMNAGRRPMIKYPDLWATPHELAHALRLINAKLPISHVREVFALVNSRLTQMRVDGKRTDRINAAAWLSSWALTEVLQQYNNELKARRNETWTRAS